MGKLKLNGFTLLESIIAIAILLICVSACISLIGQMNYIEKVNSDYHQTLYLIDDSCCANENNATEISVKYNMIKVIKVRGSDMTYYRAISQQN